MNGADDILRFWFIETESKQWWTADPAFDARIRERFAPVHAAASRGELYPWRATPAGRLAEIVVLDQFSRNLYRGTPAAFACDGIALVLAQEAVARAADREFEPVRRAFLYLPYTHSESLVIHDAAERLFSQPGLEENLKLEREHRAVLERFGRYPHRNAVLARTSTAQELEFLKQAPSWAGAR